MRSARDPSPLARQQAFGSGSHQIKKWKEELPNLLPQIEERLSQNYPATRCYNQHSNWDVNAEDAIELAKTQADFEFIEGRLTRFLAVLEDSELHKSVSGIRAESHLMTPEVVAEDIERER